MDERDSLVDCWDKHLFSWLLSGDLSGLHIFREQQVVDSSLKDLDQLRWVEIHEFHSLYEMSKAQQIF